MRAVMIASGHLSLAHTFVPLSCHTIYTVIVELDVVLDFKPAPVPYRRGRG